MGLMKRPVDVYNIWRASALRCERSPDLVL